MRELTKTEESTASTLKGANCQCECVECECVECECVELEYSPIPHPACPLHGELGEEISVRHNGYGKACRTWRFERCEN